MPYGVITEKPYLVNIIYGKTVNVDIAIELARVECEGKT